jgi:predicted Zn-dependent peptidase
LKLIRYDRLNETLYSETLPNGLEVLLLPKTGFSKTYAVFSTRYGSADNRFRKADGSEVRLPDGIAHFLEHKMFEEPEGDVFQKFAAHGASANAFTSFDRTAYLFSSTRDVEDNVETLLDFVQAPYFTDENVEKEKGIIGQEIQMYRDNPNWRVYYGLIEAMYAEDPIRIDIAGTIESIGTIDKETLYLCHETFYHPGNMLLFVVGAVEPERMMERIRANQAGKTFPPYRAPERIYPAEPEPVKERMRVVELPVSLPKCFFGFKEKKPAGDGDALARQEAATRVMLDLLIGPSSDLYQALYDEDLISDSFGFDCQMTPRYAYSMIGGDTRDPDLLLERVKEGFGRFAREGFAEADFERVRGKRIGNFLRMFNSPEAIANEYTRHRFRGIDPFGWLDVYESLTLEDVTRRFAEHVNWERLAVSVVRSGSRA